MAYTNINGVDLYYEIHGEGAPLIMIAGLASDSQSWQPVLQKLARRYRVIIFDNRGAGRTQPQDAATGIGQMADDCIALIKHLGLSSAHILGHSMGGFVALDCAIRYPEYVSKLILASTSAFCSERNEALFNDWVAYLESDMSAELWFRNMFYWIFSKQFFEDTATVNEAVRLSVAYPYPQSKTAFKNQVGTLEKFNCRESLPDITSETLVIGGTEDLIFSPEESTAVLSAIPEVTFSFIQQAAHALHVEKPQEFTAMVKRFLG